jgi:hypothetical protein
MNMIAGITTTATLQDTGDRTGSWNLVGDVLLTHARNRAFEPLKSLWTQATGEDSTWSCPVSLKHWTNHLGFSQGKISRSHLKGIRETYLTVVRPVVTACRRRKRWFSRVTRLTSRRRRRERFHARSDDGDTRTEPLCGQHVHGQGMNV